MFLYLRLPLTLYYYIATYICNVIQCNVMFKTEPNSSAGYTANL